MGAGPKRPERTASARSRGAAHGLTTGFVMGLAAPGLLRWVAGQAAQRRQVGESGARASSPGRIPARGWMQILRRAWAAFNTDHILAAAAGVTFFALLALFPALAAFVSLYGLAADVKDAQGQVEALAGVLPAGALSVLSEQMTRLAAANHASLGLAFLASLGLSVWSANAGVKALFSGLNVAYEAREQRGFIVLNAVSLAFTAGMVVLAAGVAAAVAAAPATLEWLHLGDLVGLSLLRWPALFLAIVGLCSLLYRFGPSRKLARWRWITPGSVAAALSWLVMSILFSWYVGHFGSFNRTYGSLGALMGFMTWIWLSVTVVLAGAELNAEIERQSGADTTTGARSVSPQAAL